MLAGRGTITSTGRPPSCPGRTSTPSARAWRVTRSSHRRWGRTGGRGPSTGRTRTADPTLPAVIAGRGDLRGLGTAHREVTVLAAVVRPDVPLACAGRPRSPIGRGRPLKRVTVSVRSRPGARLGPTDAARTITSTLPAVNAPKLFEEMLKTQIAPALRELGMRGSGQNFRLPNENGGQHALLGFQKDSRDSVHAVHRERDARRVGMAGGPRSARLAADHAHRRLDVPPRPGPPVVRAGGVVDGSAAHDHWWTIRAADDVPAVAAHVIAVVREAVLPQLRARLSGSEPPRPTKKMGPVLDCPAPTCANPSGVGGRRQSRQPGP